MRSWMEFGFNPMSFGFELEYPRFPAAMPAPLYRVYLHHMKRFQTCLFLNSVQQIQYAGFVLDNSFSDTAGGAGFRLIQPPIFLRNAMLNGFALGDGTNSSPVWDLQTTHPEPPNQN